MDGDLIVTRATISLSMCKKFSHSTGIYDLNWGSGKSSTYEMPYFYVARS